MFPLTRFFSLGLASLAIAGCAQPTGAPVPTPPPESTAPESSAPEVTPPASEEATPAPEATPTGSPAPSEPAPEAAATAADGVSYEPIKFDAFLKAVADNDAKYTIVDCWASWCGPCKENFPHVLEMHKKFGDKGLKVVSMSFDGGTGEAELDAQEIESAMAFLAEQKAETTNYRLDEERDLMFERFDILAIPAVFVYDADGKEVKRYTWDDPNNQFTYEQVEKEVAELLGIAPE